MTFGMRTWLGLAVALFLLQELPWFRARWVEDESWYSITGYTFLQEGHLRNPTFATHSDSKVDEKPFAMPLTLAGAFRLFGVSIVSARVLSLMAGLALIIVVYLLGLEVGGPAVAAGAALLIATDNFLFLAARTARPEAYVTLFTSLAFLLWAKARRSGSLKLVLLSGLSAGIGINYHPAALGLAFSLGCLVLYECGRQFWKDPRLAAIVAGIILPIVPFAVWTHSDAEHRAAFEETYLKQGRSQNLRQNLLAERTRYADFIGASSQRLPLPFHIPYRLHIAVALLAGMAILYWKNRALSYTIMIAVLPSLLLWIYLPNKSSRYFAVIAPVFAILIGSAAFTKWPARRFVRLATVAAGLLVMTQVAGNAILLYRSRPAQYAGVAAGLQTLIPKGNSVYGAITFWMALHDRPYYAYNRTKFDYATEKLRPNYMILNDRVMISGEGYGEDNWTALRKQAEAYVAEHGSLAGKVPNDFYGDLEVYRIHYQ
jgi:4-amino-4-deoxy-L-arabinose transferase-like glycosyltransferase